jgi:hypothetical protein
MERKINYSDLGQVSKKTVDKNKRLEQQGEGFLKEYYAKLNKEQQLAEQAKQDEILSNARFSQASPYAKNKERARLMEETVKYTDNTITAVMTDVLSTIVENSLLLDSEDYAKLNPEYKSEIKGTIRSLLERGDIEANLQNKKTLAIMEHVAKNIPQVKTGIYLKEEEIIDMVKRSTPAEINSVIESLAGDVKERVAGIVVKEQDQAAEIENEVQSVRDAAGIPAEQAPVGMPELPEEVLQALAEVGIQATPDGQFVDQEGNPVPPEAIEQILGEMQGGEEAVEGEMPEQQGMAPEMDEEDEYLAYQQGEATPGFSQPTQSSVVPATANKNTAVEVGPDGTVKINIVRERFYREVPRQGILESLALNEAQEMIKEGKKYNGDLALANALVQLTILETFNATGLMPISEMDYNKMLNIPKKRKHLKEELGSAAAEPVHGEKDPKEHQPELKNSDIYPSEDHQQSEEIEEVVVESAWKDKARNAIGRVINPMVKPAENSDIYMHRNKMINKGQINKNVPGEKSWDQAANDLKNKPFERLAAKKESNKAWKEHNK